MTHPALHRIVLIAVLSACLSGFAVPMASQPWVTNRIASAIAALPPSGVTTNDVCNIVTNEVPTSGYTDEWIITPSEYNGIAYRISYEESYGWVLVLGVDVVAFNDAPTNAVSLSFLPDPDMGNVTAVRKQITRNALGLARLVDLPPLTNGLIGAAFIATNNPAFVEAVTNCPVAIATSDAEALTEWGIYGGGGTIGALLAALAAAVAALKKKKMPLYPVGGSGNPVNATYESGVLTVSPFAMAAYTPTASAAFSVAMGALPSDMESGKARDAVLVIDCSLLSEGDEPTVTWGVNYHPRTDAATDFACVAGAKNVYYISEYATGEFAVGGWTETAGGNA